MNILERRALSRAENKLGGLLEAGEAAIEFDVGTVRGGQRVDAVVTDRALYLIPEGRGADAIRLNFSAIGSTGGSDSYLELDLLSGDRVVIEWRGRGRGVGLIVVDKYREVAKMRHHVHVSWGAGGARFLVLPAGQPNRVHSSKLDEGVADDMDTSMIHEQARGELEVRLGITPTLQYSDPRPVWMPNFVWNPPLDSLS